MDNEISSFAAEADAEIQPSPAIHQHANFMLSGQLQKLEADLQAKLDVECMLKRRARVQLKHRWLLQDCWNGWMSLCRQGPRGNAVDMQLNQTQNKADPEEKKLFKVKAKLFLETLQKISWRKVRMAVQLMSRVEWGKNFQKFGSEDSLRKTMSLNSEPADLPRGVQIWKRVTVINGQIYNRKKSVPPSQPFSLSRKSSQPLGFKPRSGELLQLFAQNLLLENNRLREENRQLTEQIEDGLH